MNTYNQAKELVNQGLLSVRSDGEVEVFCYTKECFFGTDTWNDITKSHRGQMYYNGVPVNKPFNKIFNIDEVPETAIDIVMDRMTQEPYKILHKSNGHLFIVSCFVDNDSWKVKYSTKGSLPNPGNDLLNNDIAIWKLHYEQNFLETLSSDSSVTHVTLMFEAIVSHDKHTMYDLETEKYGTDTFVLLGGNVSKGNGSWTELELQYLQNIANQTGVPVVEVFSDLPGAPTDWLDHTNTEGYVIWFENGDRVKVKTKEYWLARTKKDLTPEVIVGAFRQAGFDRLNRRFPEEVTEQLCNLVKNYYTEWLYEHEWETLIIRPRYFDVDMQARDIMSSTELTKGQKEFIINYRKANDRGDENATQSLEAKAATSRDKRKRFYDYFLSSSMIDAFQDELVHVIENM